MAVDVALVDPPCHPPGCPGFPQPRLRSTGGQSFVRGDHRQPIAALQRVGEIARAGGHIGGAGSARNSHEQPSRAPLLNGAVEKMPGWPACGFHRPERCGRAGEQIPGGHADSPVPEVEREQDVAIGGGGQFRPPVRPMRRGLRHGLLGVPCIA